MHVVSFETTRSVDERTCISKTSGVFIKVKVKENLRRTAVLLLYILHKIALHCIALRSCHGRGFSA